MNYPRHNTVLFVIYPTSIVCWCTEWINDDVFDCTHAGFYV